MIIGFDTGYFIELLKGNKDAINIWKSLEEENDGIVSCLTFFELERLGLKGAIKDIETLIESIKVVCRVIWFDFEILSSGAKLSHGIGIPSIDALILSSLLNNNVNVIYTTDKHLSKYSRKGINVINLRD